MSASLSQSVPAQGQEQGGGRQGEPIDSPGQVEAGLLAARQGDAAVADEGVVAVLEGLEVLVEGAGLDRRLVLGRLEVRTEEDVLPDGGREDPGLLQITHGF